jgi:numb-like protein
MHVCELAIERLLAEKEKNKPIKAILYISGDSLRVVDEVNKTLLVDQTIEKVSFCAPDRHHENGFAYICRDGTTRRWLCHGFMATKDTLKNTAPGSSGGERLSHAVGCAFSVCLEKKQKRERENVSMEVGPNHSFTRLGSFRQASLTERFEDPQMVMPSVDPVPIKPVENPNAIERPRPKADPFIRQNALRSSIGPSGVGIQMPFKRNQPAYQSLRPGELPSFQEQKISSGYSNGALNSNQTPSITKASLLAHSNSTVMPKSDTINRINTIAELPEEQFISTNDLNQNNNSNNFENAFNNKLVIQSNSSPTVPAQIQVNTTTPVVDNTINWANFSTQQPTAFATPQSINSTTPSNPILPAINNNTLPPPLPALNPALYFQTPVSPNSIYQTPTTYSNPPMMTIMNTSSSLVSSPTSSSSNFNTTGETFEQKWDRIQQAKKTNPFAEDIAKKYEIKL